MLLASFLVYTALTSLINLASGNSSKNFDSLVAQCLSEDISIWHKKKKSKAYIIFFLVQVDLFILFIKTKLWPYTSFMIKSEMLSSPKANSYMNSKSQLLNMTPGN